MQRHHLRDLLYLLVLALPVYLLFPVWGLLEPLFPSVDGFAALGVLMLICLGGMLLTPLVYAARHGANGLFLALCIVVLLPILLFTSGGLLLLPVLGYAIGYAIHRHLENRW